MNRALFIAAAMIPMVSASAADAAELFTGIKATDCVDGVVPTATLRDKAIEAAKVPLTVPIATALVEGRLGTVARKAWGDCRGKECKGAEAALNTLHHGLLGLADAAPLVPKGFAIEVDQAAAPARVDRAAAFLNGNFAWVVVRCPATTVRTNTGTTPDRQERRPSEPEAPAFVIAKTEDDMGKDLEKRGFASIGFSSDRLADKMQWDIDAYAGFNAPILTTEFEIEPFVGFQYHTGKKVDDLSFGGALLWYPGNSGHLIRLKGAWETDHRFKSSLWRGDIGWTPPILDRACEGATVPDRSFANCEITLVADYSSVANPGSKADLLGMTDFFRVGGDVRFTYGRSLGDKLGFVVGTVGFSFRQDPSGPRGDAELFTASLGLQPSDKGNWKISIDYTNGRDLTELSRQDMIVLSVGFRY